MLEFFEFFRVFLVIFCLVIRGDRDEFDDGGVV